MTPGPWRWEQGPVTGSTIPGGRKLPEAWASGFCSSPLKAPASAGGSAAAPAPHEGCPPAPPTALRVNVTLPDGPSLSPAGPPHDRELAAPGEPLRLDVEAVVDPAVRLLRLEYVVRNEGDRTFRTLARRADVTGTVRTRLTWDLRLENGSPAPPGRYELLALAIIDTDNHPCGPGPGASEEVEFGYLVIPAQPPG